MRLILFLLSSICLQGCECLEKEKFLGRIYFFFLPPKAYYGKTWVRNEHHFSLKFDYGGIFAE